MLIWNSKFYRGLENDPVNKRDYLMRQYEKVIFTRLSANCFLFTLSKQPCLFVIWISEIRFSQSFIFPFSQEDVILFIISLFHILSMYATGFRYSFIPFSTSQYAERILNEIAKVMNKTFAG